MGKFVCAKMSTSFLINVLREVKTGLGFTLEVQMTSLRLMFIQLSQLTKWPLYVSPFFSSTNWGEVKHDTRPAVLEYWWQNKMSSIRVPICSANIYLLTAVRAQCLLTMGWFWAVFSRDSGSCKMKEKQVTRRNSPSIDNKWLPDKSWLHHSPSYMATPASLSWLLHYTFHLCYLPLLTLMVCIWASLSLPVWS